MCPENGDYPPKGYNGAFWSDGDGLFLNQWDGTFANLTDGSTYGGELDEVVAIGTTFIGPKTESQAQKQKALIPGGPLVFIRTATVTAETVTTVAAAEATAASIAARILSSTLLTLPLLFQGHTSFHDTDNQNGRITLYRGVYVGHPDYENALQGKAVPRGGIATPKEHNEGNNESIYTSWSIYPSVADKFGGRKGAGGVVLTKTFDFKTIVPSPDKFQQGEVLIPYPVSGAIVTPATPNPKK